RSFHVITGFRALRHLRRLQQFQRCLGSTDSTADHCSSEIPRLTAPQIWSSPCPQSKRMCRQAMLVASEAHSKGTRRNTMQLLKPIDELGVTIDASLYSDRDEELVAAAKGGEELA